MHPQVRLRKSDEEFDMDQSHRGTWKIKYEGSYIAVVPTRAMAIRWAIDRAQNARARSVETRVLVQDEERVFRIEWTNSRGGNRDQLPRLLRAQSGPSGSANAMLASRRTCGAASGPSLSEAQIYRATSADETTDETASFQPLS